MADREKATGDLGLIQAFVNTVDLMPLHEQLQDPNTLQAAMQEEGWERLKLCSSDPCRWVFYDRSKNQSSRWCKMASCGNREKARRFRAKNTSPRRGEVSA